ncbi:MAG: hypothetical protein EXR59_02915 [Dehalococcoidia bacterium]|nr:hypothetical protein [Dehalococcoidia bacterium]
MPTATRKPKAKTAPAKAKAVKASVRECELCDRPIRANQPVLVIANRKVYKDKKALALKAAVFTCHAKCWEQIEDEDI